MIWEDRDLPVLRAIVQLTDEGHSNITPGQIITKTQLDPVEVRRALDALRLENPPYFKAMVSGFGGVVRVMNVTGHARRTAGHWPTTTEQLARQIIEGLKAAAEAEPDEEKRTRLQGITQFLDNAGWGVLLGVAGNIASKGLGF